MGCYKNLGAYMDALEKAGELKRISTSVSAELEITEIADRVVKKGGPALLFENVDGSDFPVFIGGYGSASRMAKSLGIESLDELGGKVDGLLSLVETRPGTFWEKLKYLPRLNELAGFFPKKVKSAPCREVVAEGGDVDLGKLPVLKCWPGDGGRFFTLPLVFTRAPMGRTQNCGMYRMQVFDRNTTGMHWHRHKDGARHFEQAKKRGERLPVAVAVGCDPATVFASTVPLPEEVDEMLLAGFIRGEGVPMIAGPSTGLMVPAEAEFILEGYVDPAETRTEGPFGDHTGYYSLPDEYPVFHVTSVSHRKKPVYHATIVGRPPMEDYFMGLAIEKLFLPVLKRQHPDVVDFHMPPEGVFHNMALVSIRKRYPGQARKLMHALWGAGQAQFTKVIVVVDDDVDLREYDTLAWKVLNSIDPERDAEFAAGALDVLDHASRESGFGSKIGIDATRKWRDEGFSREWPDEISMSGDIVGKVDGKWAEFGLE